MAAVFQEQETKIVQNSRKRVFDSFGGVGVNGSAALVAETHDSLKLLAGLIYAVGMGTFVLFLYLFPAGRFVPRWSGIIAIFGVFWFTFAVFFADFDDRCGRYRKREADSL